MSQGSSPEIRREIGVFSSFGALCCATIAAPALLFGSEPGAPIGVSMDAERQLVTISIPADAGYTAVQAQTAKGNLSGTNWFNVPGGILSSNQTSFQVAMRDLPADGCMFRGVTDQLRSDLRISKEPYGSDMYHIVVTVDDAVLRNKDGSLNPSQFSHWTIQNSTDGVHWTSSGYVVIPGGTQFALRIPSSGGSEPFFMSRIQHVP